jgi:hypothetical protein
MSCRHKDMTLEYEPGEVRTVNTPQGPAHRRPVVCCGVRCDTCGDVLRFARPFEARGLNITDEAKQEIAEWQCA